MRNNSHYFGRDRLPDPVYVAFGTPDPTLLRHLRPQDLVSENGFVPWEDLFRHSASEISFSDGQRRVARLLSRLDQLNSEISRWLTTDGQGFDLLREFLVTKVASSSSPLYLASVTGSAPSWAPQHVLPVSRESLSQMTGAEYLQKALNLDKLRFVMLSGAGGDFP